VPVFRPMNLTPPVVVDTLLDTPESPATPYR
jgi:hypothetical protein